MLLVILIILILEQVSRVRRYVPFIWGSRVEWGDSSDAGVGRGIGPLEQVFGETSDEYSIRGDYIEYNII